MKSAQLPTYPGDNAPEKLRIAYHFQYALRQTQINNSLESSDVASLLDKNVTAVSPWFLTTENVRIPRGEDLFRVNDRFNNQYSGLMPSGIHGRVFNYVYFFEGQPFTKYEKTLMARVSELEDELHERKIQVKTLQGELDRMRTS